MRSNTYYKKESRELRKIGQVFLNDTQYTMKQRLDNWKNFLEEFFIERDKILMKSFKEKNGFEATDDDSKRKLIDTVFYEHCHRYPKDDYEREYYNYSHMVDRHLMRIGWKPFQSLSIKQFLQFL